MKEKSGLTTHEVREWFGMSQAEFAQQFKIPVATVRNWDARGTMPTYIRDLCLEIRESWDRIAELEHSVKVLTGEIKPGKY